MTAGLTLKVIQGDCLEVLDTLHKESIHLTITDPPYESLERHRKVGTTTRLSKSKASSNEWFDVLRNVDYWALFSSLHVVHANNTHCYVFCDSETEHVILSGRNPYDTALDNELLDFEDRLQDPMGPPFACFGRAWPTLSWLKTKQAKCWKEPEDVDDSDITSGMGYHWRRTSERILFLEKGKRRLNNLGWKDTLLGPRGGRDDPPAKKPESVIERLILNSTEPGEVILDPFAGSGVVGRIALKHGRSAILIDVDTKHLKPKTWPEVNGTVDVEVR